MPDETGWSFVALGILKGLLPLLGVIVGAGLHYLSSFSMEVRRHRRQLKLEAYTEYLRSIGEMETAHALPGANDRAAAVARAISAKARVCVTGSEEVVKVLSSFEAETESGLTPKKKNHLVALVLAIRKDLGESGTPLTIGDVERILFRQAA